MRIALGASLLVSAAAFVVMYLYMRTVFRETQRRGSPVNAGTEVDAGEREPPLPMIPPLQIGTEMPVPWGGSPAARSPTFEHAESAFRKAAGVYVLAGSVHVVASVALLFLFRVLSIPSTSSRSSFSPLMPRCSGSGRRPRWSHSRSSGDRIGVFVGASSGATWPCFLRSVCCSSPRRAAASLHGCRIDGEGPGGVRASTPAR